MLGQLALRLGADTLRRRVWRAEGRMLILDLPQLPHEPIPLGVRSGRCVEDVILVVGALDLLSKPFRTSGKIVMNVCQVISGEW